MSNKILIDGELYDSETGELINEVQQVEVEIVENQLPMIVCNGGTHIQTNTEQLKKELIVHLAKYDVEVTEETEKEASKMATELNKLAIDLNKKRLEVGKLIKKPADDLKTSIDELIDIVQDKRVELLQGVEVFKQKRFGLIRSLLIFKLESLYNELKVSGKYRVCSIEPLVVEGSLGNTKLSKKAIESLESMVRRVKALEDAVTIREMQLELKCNKAGLITNIELNEVQHFIEDDNYDEILEDMINSRLEIERKVKENAEKQEQLRLEAIEKQKTEDEARRKEDDIRKEAFRLSELERVEREKNEAIENIRLEAERKEKQRLDDILAKEIEEANRLKAIEDAKLLQEKETGKKIVRLTAVFEIEVNADLDDMKVLTKYKDKLASEYTTLKSVSVN